MTQPNLQQNVDLQEVQKFTHNKLTILVTHRPKTLRFVDEIIDLNE